MYIHGRKLLDALKGWGHSLGKSIAIQQQQYSAKVVDELPLIEEPDSFLDNKVVSEKLKCAIQQLQSGMNKNDVLFLTAYCAAMILYYNGQRYGVIENVTIEEFTRRIKNEEGTVVMTCMQHKTSSTQGLAHLVFKKTTDELLSKYYSLVHQRIQPKEGASQLLFLTVNGSRYSQVYRKLQEAIKVNKIKDVELPKPSQYCNVGRTDGSHSLPDPGLRNMSRHMCHSSETARKYYKYSDLSDAVLAHKTITEMAKRRAWSKEETEALLEAWPLEISRPELKICSVLKDKCNLSHRTTKNIHEKWRQLENKQQHAQAM